MNCEKEDRIRELERQIADIKSRLPAHSVKPVMLMQLEELEEELERLKESEGEVSDIDKSEQKSDEGQKR